MEQKPKKGITFKVLWHSEIVDDFRDIPQNIVENIIEASTYRLSQAPQLVGAPLKGTTNLVWKMRFSAYRILFTMNQKSEEVWVLSVKHRSVVYNQQNIMSVLQMAIAIHQSGGSIKPLE